MSNYKRYSISYTMVDGEVFKSIESNESYRDVIAMVHEGLNEKSFDLSEYSPAVILVSANVRNVEIVEKV